MTRAFISLLRREILIAMRIGGGGFMAVFFFLTLVAIVPLGLGPDLRLLGLIAPGLLWIGLLLSSLLTLERLFQADYEDGSLDLFQMGPLPLEGVAFAKALSHWLTTGLPLIIASPFLGLLLNLEPASVMPLVKALIIGTPALSFLGSIGAALTVSVKRGGLLGSLLVLPFFIPVLIFGVSAAQADALGLIAAGHQALLLLAALTLASIVLSPVAAAAALRANLQ